MTAPSTTRSEIQRCAAAGCVVLLAGSIVMGMLLDFETALLWGISAGIGWLYVVHQAWRRRSLNCASPNSAPYATLGKATELTLLRGLLIAATGGFLLLDNTPVLTAAVPALFYSLAAILDRVDGGVARKTHHTSVLGSELDTVTDAMGLLIAPLLAVLYGKVHWSYLLASIAYYWFMGGLALRTRQGLPNYPLQPSRLRRTLAGFQMGFVAVALWPFMHPVITRIAGVAFMLPLLAGFMVDWWVVSGRLDPQHPRADSSLATLDWLGASLLLPALRVAVVLVLGRYYATGDLLLFRLADYGLPALLPGWIMLIAAGCLLAGVGTRIAALVLITALAGCLPVFRPDFTVTPALLILVCSTVWLMLLGSGRFSIWQGDDIWVNRVDGAS